MRGRGIGTARGRATIMRGASNLSLFIPSEFSHDVFLSSSERYASVLLRIAPFVVTDMHLAILLQLGVVVAWLLLLRGASEDDTQACVWCSVSAVQCYASKRVL